MAAHPRERRRESRTQWTHGHSLHCSRHCIWRFPRGVSKAAAAARLPRKSRWVVCPSASFASSRLVEARTFGCTTLGSPISQPGPEVSPPLAAMALRRATAGLASLIGSISRSQVKDRAVFPPLASQHQAQSTLVSLRSFLAPAAPLDDSGSSIHVAAVQTGRRSVSSASAGAALPAPAADQESLEHIRARIFGNHIGG